MRRTQQPQLLTAPPCVSHLVDRRLPGGHLQCRSQQDRRSRTVVVDPRPLRDTVEVCAGHHDVGGISGLRLGEQVVGGVRLDVLREGEAQLHLTGGHRGAQSVALGRGDPGGRDETIPQATERPVQPAGPVVRDDHHGCSGLGCRPVHVREAASATLGDADLPGHLGRPVRGPAAVPVGRGHQHTGDALVRGAGREAQRRLIDHPAAGIGQLRVAGVRDLDGEVLPVDIIETRRHKLVLDPPGGGRIAGTARPAASARVECQGFDLGERGDQILLAHLRGEFGTGSLPGRGLRGSGRRLLRARSGVRTSVTGNAAGHQHERHADAERRPADPKPVNHRVLRIQPRDWAQTSPPVSTGVRTRCQPPNYSGIHEATIPHNLGHRRLGLRIPQLAGPSTSPRRGRALGCRHRRAVTRSTTI